MARSIYATGMLRSGFDVQTVQHWMGHKSLETTRALPGAGHLNMAVLAVSSARGSAGIQCLLKQCIARWAGGPHGSVSRLRVAL